MEKRDLSCYVTVKDHNRLRLFEELNNQRDRDGGRLCDVILVSECKKFHAHRNVLAATSPYFERMFAENTFKEGSIGCPVIELPSVEACALKEVLDAIYKGKMYLDLSNVHLVVAAADQMLLPSVTELCITFMNDILISEEHRIKELLNVRQTAILYSLDSILSKTNYYLNKSFFKISQTQFYFELNVEEVLELLSSDDIEEHKELVFWEAAIKWIKYDEVNRKKHIPDIMSNIRFPLMMPSEIYELVLSEPLMQHSPFCSEIIQDALKYQLIPSIRSSSQSPRTKPRATSNKTIIYCISGESDFLCYVQAHKRWYSLQAPHKYVNDKSEHIQYDILVCNESVYALGKIPLEQEVSNYTVKCMQRFNISENKWTSCSMPNNSGQSPTLIQCCNRLFACSPEQIEEYDEINDSWLYFSTGKVGPYHFVVSDDTGLYFYNLFTGVCCHVKLGRNLSPSTTQILSPCLFIGDILSITKLNSHEVLIFLRSPSRSTRKIFNLKTNMWREANLYYGLGTSCEPKSKVNYPQCLNLFDIWECLCDRDQQLLYVVATKSGISDVPPHSQDDENTFDGVLPFFLFDLKENTWKRLPCLPERIISNTIKFCIYDGRSGMASCNI